MYVFRWINVFKCVFILVNEDFWNFFWILVLFGICFVVVVFFEDKNKYFFNWENCYERK